MNPHRLKNGAIFWTSCPFDAMSIASANGARVERYYSGQYIPGMIPDSGHQFFGYGVTYGNGFELFNKHTRILCNQFGNAI